MSFSNNQQPSLSGSVYCSNNIQSKNQHKESNDEVDQLCMFILSLSEGFCGSSSATDHHGDDDHWKDENQIIKQEVCDSQRI